ncbi:MAG: RING finger protein 166-like protein [Terrestrivirus sp.]|uniref:RING finger protein 166-like protein n=1 Tax=Terrestrivirus sp. TaxID=2487775 RepID=A0A3G4ZN30_9VIRU|nr:MAG: RING finger protein 166-like protein [Terrestrivirus sp.]
MNKLKKDIDIKDVVNSSIYVSNGFRGVDIDSTDNEFHNDVHIHIDDSDDRYYENIGATINDNISGSMSSDVISINKNNNKNDDNPMAKKIFEIINFINRMDDKTKSQVINFIVNSNIFDQINKNKIFELIEGNQLKYELSSQKMISNGLSLSDNSLTSRHEPVFLRGSPDGFLADFSSVFFGDESILKTIEKNRKNPIMIKRREVPESCRNIFTNLLTSNMFPKDRSPKIHLLCATPEPKPLSKSDEQKIIHSIMDDHNFDDTSDDSNDDDLNFDFDNDMSTNILDFSSVFPSLSAYSDKEAYDKYKKMHEQMNPQEKIIPQFKLHLVANKIPPILSTNSTHSIRPDPILNVNPKPVPDGIDFHQLMSESEFMTDELGYTTAVTPNTTNTSNGSNGSNGSNNSRHVENTGFDMSAVGRGKRVGRGKIVTYEGRSVSSRMMGPRAVFSSHFRQAYCSSQPTEWDIAKQEILNKSTDGKLNVNEINKLYEKSFPRIYFDLGECDNADILSKEYEYTCSICTCIFNKPQYLHCKHTFCVDCIDRIHNQKCPLCVTPFLSHQVFPNKELDEMLSVLRFKCSTCNKTHCGNDCSVFKAKCKKCKKEMTKNEFFTHVTEEKAMKNTNAYDDLDYILWKYTGYEYENQCRIVKKCTHCSGLYYNEKIEEHEKVCDKQYYTCKGCCEQIKKIDKNYHEEYCVSKCSHCKGKFSRGDVILHELKCQMKMNKKKWKAERKYSHR